MRRPIEEPIERPKRGKSIRIYLDQGEVAGIRHAELVNMTSQALLCPRNRVGELSERWSMEASRTGVYFLLGEEDSGSRRVYIGEAENVLARLKQHLVTTDFWQESILVTSKDENLTKAHVKYLESRLVEIAKSARRYSVENTSTPARSGLPRADQDAMEEYLDHLPLLMGVLGHRVLDSLTSDSTGTIENFYVFEIKTARATGRPTDEGFVVFEGSTALPGVRNSMPAGWRSIKKELVDTGRLVEQGSLLSFTQDVLFKSPSAAAAIVYGNNANGRILWKTRDGKTLKEVEEEAAKL